MFIIIIIIIIMIMIAIIIIIQKRIPMYWLYISSWYGVLLRTGLLSPLATIQYLDTCDCTLVMLPH